MAKKPVKVETLTHAGAARRNIPTAEYQSVAERIEEQNPTEPAHYQRARPLAEGETRERDQDLDPQIIWRGARLRVSKEQARRLLETGEVEIGDAQLVWRGKDRQDWSDLVVPTPPIYIQEKVHPKAIIDDLERRKKEPADQADMFADFNGLDDPEARTEFYQHDQHWSNRFVLGDSLGVMASLAERESLRGKVQCIYFDPPYGIKFNSNWQVSTLSRDVKDGKQQDVSREPEQIKAFRDTWKDGIHSYLTYLRDRLTVARESCWRRAARSSFKLATRTCTACGSDRRGVRGREPCQPDCISDNYRPREFHFGICVELLALVCTTDRQP
jgi:adenine-specific DNA-methyltransferase